MMGTTTAKYVDDRFVEHTFGVPMMFVGPYQALSFEPIATPKDAQNFLHRRDAEGNPFRRMQVNNQEQVYCRVLSVHGSLSFHLASYYADMKPNPAKLYVEAFMKDAYLDYSQKPDPVPHMGRMGASGKVLVPGEQVHLRALHQVSYYGDPNFHWHMFDTGYVLGPDGKMRSRADNRLLFYEAWAKHLQWNESLYHTAQRKGFTSVRLIDGIAQDPTITREQMLAVGIGARREEIVKVCAQSGFEPTRAATFVANNITRERPPKTFKFEERAEVWGTVIRNVRSPERVLVQVPKDIKDEKKPPFGREALRAFKKAAQVAKWIYLKIRWGERETFRIRGIDEMKRFIADTSRKPFWVGMLAARKAVAKTRIKDIAHGCQVATEAHRKAVRPDFVPTKKHRVIISPAVFYAMDRKELKHLFRLSKKTGCEIKVPGITKKQFRAHAKNTRRRSPER